jgi:hypothetical protein
MTSVAADLILASMKNKRVLKSGVLFLLALAVGGLPASSSWGVNTVALASCNVQITLDAPANYVGALRSGVMKQLNKKNYGWTNIRFSDGFSDPTSVEMRLSVDFTAPTKAGWPAIDGVLKISRIDPSANFSDVIIVFEDTHTYRRGGAGVNYYDLKLTEKEALSFVNKMTSQIPRCKLTGHSSSPGSDSSAESKIPVRYGRPSSQSMKACGKEGSIEARLENCKTNVRTSKGFLFSLVTKMGDGTGESEVWMDRSTQMLWGDLIRKNGWLEVSYADALGACSGSGESNGLIGDSSFGLPSADDFIKGESHGFREVLPNFRGAWYWTSTQQKDYVTVFYEDGQGRLISGGMSIAGYTLRKSARCIARAQLDGHR